MLILNNEPEIFLFDMDGVLADYAKAFEEISGYKDSYWFQLNELNHKRNGSLWKKENFKPEDYYNLYRHQIKAFNDIQLLHKIIKLLKRHGKTTGILSACGSSQYDLVKQAKEEWLIDNNISQYFDVKHFTKKGGEKKIHSNEKTLLIDDYGHNVSEFTSNNIGSAILHNNMKTTYKIIKEIIE